MAEDGITQGSGNQGGQDGGQAGSGASGGSPGDFTSFRSTLGDLGKEKSLDVIKDFSGLAKGYVEGQKLIGRSIQIPAKEMKPEDRKKAIGNIMGKLRSEGILEAIPEAPDKYEIKFPQEEGFQVNEPFVKAFKEMAHKLQVPPTAVQGLFDWYVNYQAEAEALEDKAFDDAKIGLKKEWGGLYTRRMEAARRAVTKYLGADGEGLLSQIPASVSTKLVRAFAQIGDPMIEDAIVTGELTGVKKSDEVKRQMEAMILDPKHPLNDISHPKHNEAVAEYTELNKMYSQLTAKK